MYFNKNNIDVKAFYTIMKISTLLHIHHMISKYFRYFKCSESDTQ